MTISSIFLEEKIPRLLLEIANHFYLNFEIYYLCYFCKSHQRNSSFLLNNKYKLKSFITNTLEKIY